MQKQRAQNPASYHEPVMVQEIIGYLIGDAKGIYIDATLGGAGHTIEILNHLGADARVFGIDRDPDAHKAAAQRIGNDSRFFAIHGTFSNIKHYATAYSIGQVNGILADFGVSSFQLDTAERGFSYLRHGPLDLRMDPTTGESAAELLARVEEKELADLIFHFGEERQSRKIARAIVNQRVAARIETTSDLVDLLDKTLPNKNRIKSISRVFQALRIAVNHELEEIEQFLDGAFSILKSDGRLAVLTYHSLEDRLCKQFFKEKATDCTCPPEFPVCVCEKKAEATILTRKVITASNAEINRNVRARSAKLRVLEKLDWQQ